MRGATFQHIKTHRDGFPIGETCVTRIEEPDEFGIGFSILRLKGGERVERTLERETAYLLMGGILKVACDAAEAHWVRRSLFDERPSALHAGKGARVVLESKTECELAVFEVANQRMLPSRIIDPSAVRDELRGRDQVRDMALRTVRTVFDRENSPEAAELVLGEVVNFPGRWSSYPPHHHPQPEIYHYRFVAKEGWGHAEVGEDVLRVRGCDTVKIAAGQDHPQCAAPGYGMYYAWVIRHLPGQPYLTPEFTPEHRWILERSRPFWWPTGIDDD